MKREEHLIRKYSIVCCFLLPLLGYATGEQRIDYQNNNEAQLRQNISSLPIAFRKNKGQWEDKILYGGGTPYANVYFMKNGLSFGFTRASESIAEAQETHLEQKEMMIWNLEFKGANSFPEIIADGETASNVSYIRGNNPDRWVSQVPEYRLLTYRELYPKIDLRYYAHTNSLKYDYILKQGADIADIKLSCTGIKKLLVNRRGELEITTPWGILVEKKPYSYQYIDGKETEVKISYYVENDTTYGFRFRGSYDSRFPVVIDPIILEWCTFAGGQDVPGHKDPGTGTAGNGSGDGYAHDIEVDDAGNVYCTGLYTVGYFTTPGVYDTGYNTGWYDGIAFKLSPDGKTMLYATFIGGNGYDVGEGIALDKKTGEVVIVGKTSSIIGKGGIIIAANNNFPTTVNAYDTKFNGGPSFDPTKPYRFDDTFILRLTAKGDKLVYSTFIGGSGLEEPARGGIEMNSKGEVFITGYTSSPDFPTTVNAFDRQLDGPTDAFVLKLKADGSDIIYSTLIGGTGRENSSAGCAACPLTALLAYGSSAGSIVINANDEAYITGWTESTDFPLQNPLQGANKGMFDAYVTKLNSSGSGLVYSTYLGGNQVDAGVDITLDPVGNACVVGLSHSPNFPATPGAMDNSNTPVGGSYYEDGFVARFNSAGNALSYATLVGSSYCRDKITGVKFNTAGEYYIVGETAGASAVAQQIFPITSCALYNTFNGVEDFLICKFSPTNQLVFGTLLGGAGYEYQAKVAIREIKPCGEELTISGGSHSYETNGFPVTPGVYQPKRLGTGLDIPVVFRLKPQVNADFIFSAPACKTPIQFTDKSKSDCIWKPGSWLPTSWQWDFGDGTSSTEQNPVHQFSAAGTYRVKLKVNCPTDSVIKTIVIPSDPGLSVDLGRDTTLCKGGTVTLDAGNPGATYSWSTGENTSSIQVNTSGTIYVLVDKGGNTCPVKDSIKIIIKDPPQLHLRDTTLCEGPFITLDAENSGAVYHWNTNAVSQTIQVNKTGQYWVRVNLGSCKISDTVTIVFNPFPVLSLKDTTICAIPGAAVTLDAENPGSVYSWSTGENIRQIQITEAGKYILEVDNQGCKKKDSAEVIIKPLPVVDIRDTTVCEGVQVTLDAGNSGTAYSWNTNAITSTITINEPGQYIVEVILGSCKNRDTSNVVYHAYPMKNLKDIVLCAIPGVKVKLDAGNPGSTYLWSTNESTREIEVTESGKYIVEIKNYSCAIKDSMILALKAAPQVIINDTLLCGVGAIVLDAGNPGADYSWNTGVQTQTISVEAAGVYYVKVDNGICISTDTAKIQFAQPVKVFLQKDTTFCANPSLKLVPVTLGDVFSYEWNTGATTSYISIEHPGAYSVKVVSPEGCWSSDTMRVTVEQLDKPSVNISLCQLDVGVLDAANPGATYSWSTGAATKQIEVFSSGKYWVTVTRNGCSVTDTSYVTGEANSSSLFVPNAFTPTNDLRNEFFTAAGTGIVSFKMEIFNRWGELYFTTTDINRGWDGRYNGTLVQEDVYIWKIQYTTDCNTAIKSHIKMGHVSVIR